ncbi:MAG: TIR domain-containing protein [Acidobacteriota bacterium]|nr:TIR domain-containing protein [Acidobacteriota bacterium]
MGGSRSNRSFSPKELADLTRAAKEALKGADQPRRRCVFISFAFEDLNEVNLLRGQAKNENAAFEMIDRSLQEPFESERAEYIKEGIRDRIKQASVTLVYLSERTAHSKWVEWEIQESVRLGKGVIGVFQGDKAPEALPKALGEAKAKIVSWNHENIANAIDEASRKRT